MLPVAFGLQHESWRPHQAETITAVLNSEKPFLLEAPTGSGKTACARAVSQKYKTVALVRTKALQAENYDEEYRFTAMYGRGNYRCVHPENSGEVYADECRFAEVGMTKCPVYNECPYVQAREAAKEAQRAVLNYAYWMHVYQKWPEFEMLVLDEAHQLPDIVLDWAGIKVSNTQRAEWGLPPFPVLRSDMKSRSVMEGSETTNAEGAAMRWLAESRQVLLRMHSTLSVEAEYSHVARKRLRACELLGKKIAATLEAMQTVGDCWYITSGPSERGRSISTWEFFAKPLTARYHFGHYFRKGPHNILPMSATIGDFETFANELGINAYDALRVPSVWPVTTRPIYQLDVPRIGRKTNEAGWQKQATEITRAIRACPPEWSGLVHVNSMNEADALGARLRRLGLGERVYVQKRLSTDKAVEDWDRERARHPNRILVTWALWEGYNGLDEKINIVAKVPYPFLGESYERARMAYNGRFFIQRAAWKLEQACGRSRRGRECDYDTPDEMRGLVAIADGSLNHVRSYLSEATRQALVKGLP